MNVLPAVSSIPPVSYEYFPTLWQAVLFRNWNRIPLGRLARVLNATEETLAAEAARLCLPPAEPVSPHWDKRGYLTLIRENWHLLPFDQLTVLLDMTDETLSFILKEDDFLWHKMGRIKPLVPPVHYAPLTKQQLARTEKLAAELMLDLGGSHVPENAFAFCDHLLAPVTEAERAEAMRAAAPDDGLRTVYSYFALYGDPLLDAQLDPFPEKLLCEYAKMGVKGVWLQGLLYQLIEFPFDPGLSKGHEARIANLNALIQRAARYGIGVYLYLNEPRAMSEAFFEKYPHLKGVCEDTYYSMCTSQPEVKEYLEKGMETLFREAPGLSGFFTITMSENLTNCVSRTPTSGGPCPRCAARNPWEIVAEVNNLMARGAHRAKPDAKVIAWNWAWSNDWADLVVPLLTEGQIIQCTSEERLSTSIGGVPGEVFDYTMSQPGPGPKARAAWRSALACGHEACAKVQVNNTWELACVPYLPVFDCVAAHLNNLRAEGVRHLQLSWTLGGAPTPNLKLASRIMSGGNDVRSFTLELFGRELGETAYQAQQRMSEAFRQFPFHVGVAYMAPQSFGPAAPFFPEPTGWTATMVGFPYDDLKGWRSIYPEHIFLRQLTLLADGWREGALLLRGIETDHAGFLEFRRMAEACLCHFESMLHHVEFVLARTQLLSGDETARSKLMRIISQERSSVKQLIALRGEDSRLGYEASNHYFYTQRSLEEKLLNLRYCEERLAGAAPCKE